MDDRRQVRLLCVGDASVGDKRLPGQPIGVGAHQKHDRADDVLCGADAPQRGFTHYRLEVFLGDALSRDFSHGCARCHGIDADTIWAELAGERTGEPHNPPPCWRRSADNRGDPARTRSTTD